MSDEFVVDLANYKDRVGQRIAPGKYLVLVEDAEQDTSRNGNVMVVLWLRVLDGEFKDSTILDRLVMTQNSLYRVVAFLQAIGIPTPKKRLALSTKQLIGRKLEIEVDDGEPYNGRVKSEVRGYMRATAPATEAAADDLPAPVEEAPNDPLAGIAERQADSGPAEPVDLDALEL